MSLLCVGDYKSVLGGVSCGSLSVERRADCFPWELEGMVLGLPEAQQCLQGCIVIFFSV